MSRLFLSVLDMSLTASYVILIVILVRLLLKKAPKAISYALWIVVAFRLLIPFTFESSFSLIPSKTNVGNISYQRISQQSPQPGISPQMNVGGSNSEVNTIINNLLPEPTLGASADPSQIVLEVGAYVWIFVIMSLLIYSFVSILIIKKRLKGARLIEKNIFEAKNIRTAFVLGFVNPKIYLPEGLTKEEQDYIILHEQTHIKRKDHIIKVLAFFILALHWFNPLVWIAFRLMSKDMELSCDEKVLKQMGSKIKKPYANSLLTLNTEKSFINASPLAFGEGSVKARIKNVLNYKKPAFWVILIALIFAIVIGVGLLSNPEDKDSNENQSELVGQDPVEEEPSNSQEPAEEVIVDNGVYIENFSQMDNYIQDYVLESVDGEEMQPYLPSYHIQGEYDLNGDGQVDKIDALLKADYMDGGYIEVNDIKVPLELDSPFGEMHIIDIDTRDSFYEIAIFDDGPSGDPCFIFYRYDGKDLYRLGVIDRGAVMDGQGKFISWFHKANYFKPQFFSAWGEFKDGRYSITNHDVEQYIGKDYELDGTAYFLPLDNKPDNHHEYVDWNPESLREFEAIKIKILDIYVNPEDRTLNSFYVELPEGERGLLYFWIGD